jgi:hypothetical protein
MDRQLDIRLKELNDEFLPAADYLRRAHLDHYRETQVPIGAAESPWNDWHSTLARG